MTYYKTLTEEHKGPYSNFNFAKYLPKDDQPGPWLPSRRGLKLCKKGYHVTDANHLLEWLQAEIWEVEVKGKCLEDDNKSSHSSIRFVRQITTWNDRIARLFAVWCVREALKHYQKNNPIKG